VSLPKEEAEGWQSVNSGLALNLLAQYLYMGGVGLFLLMIILAWLSASSREPGGAMVVIGTILMILSGLSLLCNWILALVGTCYWLAAPLRHGARPVAIGCLVFISLVLLRTADLSTAAQLLPGRGMEGERQGPPVALFSFLLLEIARLTVFPFFLRAMAFNFRSASLASMSFFLAMATLGFFVGFSLLSYLIILVAKSATVALIMTILYFLGWLGVLVFGMLTLMRSRRLLRSQLRREA
jgi:hypothetical protein